MICPRLFLYLLSSRSWCSPKQLSSCEGCLSWLQQGGQGCTVLRILIMCLLLGTPISSGVSCFVIFWVADQTPQQLVIVSVNEVRNQIPQGMEVRRASSWWRVTLAHLWFFLGNREESFIEAKSKRIFLNIFSYFLSSSVPTETKSPTEYSSLPSHPLDGDNHPSSPLCGARLGLSYGTRHKRGSQAISTGYK